MVTETTVQVSRKVDAMTFTGRLMAKSTLPHGEYCFVSREKWGTLKMVKLESVASGRYWWVLSADYSALQGR